jgi:hypothetical protein
MAIKIQIKSFNKFEKPSHYTSVDYMKVLFAFSKSFDILSTTLNLNFSRNSFVQLKI